ncbi:hypothetical protein C1645_845404 [Glomus cerebriforme]|uniref:Uncharacterized protein n=1 Tax=Glomus cerebriforme TaxID=658196 RepID=A0A397RZF4_9GLOM|nr:hypothetical protein C1645_845404 [Glomus cerebriforme]
MPRIFTLNDVGNNDGSKLGSPPSNRYPPSRLELEEQLKKDREMFIRSAKQLIAKYHTLDKKNKYMQNDLVRSHEENERMQDSMNQLIPLSKQLNGLNNKLVFQITCERKSHADLNAKQLKEIESLKSEINFKDSEITSLEVRINELEAQLLASSKSEKISENFTYDPSCSLIEQGGLEIRVKELKNELEKVTQNSSFKDGLIFCLRSRISDLECQAERDELDQFASQPHQISHDSKIGSAEADHETGISETLCPEKNLPIENSSSSDYKHSKTVEEISRPSRTSHFSSHCLEHELNEKGDCNSISAVPIIVLGSSNPDDRLCGDINYMVYIRTNFLSSL